MGLDLRSPKGNVLHQLAGKPGDIDKQARDLVTAAGVMESTATQLRRLADGTDTISKAESVDDVREAAGDVAPDLEKAAIRYEMTGNALIIYAAALEEAQLAILPMVEDIGEKHEAWRTARDKVVLNPYQDLADLGTGDVDPGLSQAVTVAEGELQEAWAGFDRVFGVWEEAYDAAIDGIDDAFDAADNNDAWGEDWLAVLGYVGIALCVVALFCTGPLAVVIAAIGAVVALVVVAINVCKLCKGRGNWLDLGVAIVSVIPFVRPLATAGKTIKTARAAKAMLPAGKTVMRSSVRSTMKTYGRSIPGRIGNKVNDARASIRTGALNVESKAYDFFISRPGQNWLRGGHDSLTSFGNFVRGKGADKVGGEVLEWAATNAPQKGRHVVGAFENATSHAADLYFLAEEQVPVFEERIVSRFDQ